jgi:hypothetical protein
MDMIKEYYANGHPNLESILVCDDCGEERRVRRTKMLLDRQDHPCRACSNKRNGIKKRGVSAWNSGKRYSIREVGKTSYVDTFGYRQVWCGRGEGSLGRKDGYRPEHHLVMYESIGRFLEKGEVVHHINGNKLDNRIENLHLFSSVSKHRQAHNSLEDIAMELVKQGVIVFDGSKYYLAERE